MNDKYILEDALWNDWGIIQKSDSGMFDYEDVKHQPREYVWTIVDSGGTYEDENWYAMPGFHVVNKLGYALTRRAWTSNTPDALYFLREDADDGKCNVFVSQ